MRAVTEEEETSERNQSAWMLGVFAKILTRPFETLKTFNSDHTRVHTLFPILPTIVMQKDSLSS